MVIIIIITILIITIIIKDRSRYLTNICLHKNVLWLSFVLIFTRNLEDTFKMSCSRQVY